MAPALTMLIVATGSARRPSAEAKSVQLPVRMLSSV